MDGRRRKTVHAARRPEERPKDASHSSTFTECTSAMLTLPSFAGSTSARSVTRTVRMRFSVGTGYEAVLPGSSRFTLTMPLFGIVERERVPSVPAHGAQNQLGLSVSPLEDRRSVCLLHHLFRLPAAAGHSCNTTNWPAGRLAEVTGSSAQDLRL